MASGGVCVSRVSLLSGIIHSLINYIRPPEPYERTKAVLLAISILAANKVCKYVTLVLINEDCGSGGGSKRPTHVFSLLPDYITL